MTQSMPTPAPAEDAPQARGDFFAELDTLDAARGFAPADAGDGQPARPEDAAASTPEPAGAPATGDEGAPPAAADDPIARARREAREEADREWQAKLDGTHGNVKQWREAAAREKARADQIAAQLAEADQRREAEFQQLIDAAQTAEQKAYWQDQAALDRDKREVARDKARIEADKARVADERQEAQRATETQARQTYHESLFGFLDHQARELGLPEDVRQELRDDLANSPQLAVLADAPPDYAGVHWARLGLYLERQIDRAATRHAAGRQAEDEAAARANRQRDAATGRFAAGQAGTGGGRDVPDPARHRGTGNFGAALDDIDAANQATGRYARR